MPAYLMSYDYQCSFIEEEIRGVKLNVARAQARRTVLANCIVPNGRIAPNYIVRNGYEYGYRPPYFLFKEGTKGDIEPVGYVDVRKSWNDWEAVWYPARKRTARDRAGYIVNVDGSLIS